MTRPIASHPLWTAAPSGAGITVGSAATALLDGQRAAPGRARATLAQRLEDAVLLVAASLLFPVVILLVFSPVALLIAALVSVVKRSF